MGERLKGKVSITKNPFKIIQQSTPKKEKRKKMSGKLHLCATPIGNLEDITLRVLNTLKEVDLIAAEDTRHSIKLLNHFNIKTPMTSYHEFNKIDKGKYLVEQLKQGVNIALISDAGTPGISDPGEELVVMCYEAGIEVTSLPGASAVLTALTLSGLSTRRFCFEAFLPAEKKERQLIYKELKKESRTIIVYEAPHRLIKSLKELREVLGNRRITICRELTKRFETAFLTTIEDAVSFYSENEPKGECVLVIEGVSLENVVIEEQNKWGEMAIEKHLEYYTSKDVEKKEAMKLVALDRGISKREVYNYMVNLDK